MKRDMDLIRDILLEIEGKESATSWVTVSFDGYTDEIVDYHVRLLGEEGLLKVNDKAGNMIQNLTWAGHDWLENAKNEKVWNRAKSFIQEKGGSVSASVMGEILKSFAMKQFNLE